MNLSGDIVRRGHFVYESDDHGDTSYQLWPAASCPHCRAEKR